MDYETLRRFADIWGLLYLVVAFVAVVAFVYLRPGSRKRAEEAARIPLDEEREHG